MKKTTTLMLSTLLMFGVTTCATSCSFIEGIIGKVVEDLGITLNYKSKTLVVGQSFNLYIRVKIGNEFDDQIIDSGYEITSSNEEVATVGENGLVKGVGVGKCTITVKSTDLLKYTCTVKVEEKELQSIEVNRMTTKYPLGETFKFKGIVSANYQRDFSEVITPEIDSSNVDINVRGTYPITISYEYSGILKSLTKNIDILPADEIEPDAISMRHNVDEQELHDFPFSVTALPVKGSPKMLVLPIKFSDSDNYITNYNNVKSDINDVFFADDTETSSKIGWESVRTYYEKESRDTLHITGKTADWYVDNHPSTNYYEGSGINELIENATNYYFSNNPTENRHDYDYDNDGFLDGVVAVFASPSYQSLDLPQNSMWAMVRANSAQVPNLSVPNVGKQLWASYSFMYPRESIALARTGKSTYHEMGHINSLSIKLDTHTYIHEVAHMIGIDDYYSYTTSDTYASEATMQTGTVLTHDPYSLLCFNWVDAIIPDETQTVSIDDIQSGGNVIILTPEWNENDSPYDEYIVLDLYTPTGLNKNDALTSSDLVYNNVGVRAWHVDARLSNSVIRSGSSYSYDPEKLSTNPTDTTNTKITDNSPNSPQREGLDVYDKYAELFLLRNDGVTTFSTTKRFDKNTMFKEGDSFSMEAFKDQFVESGKLDSGLDLGWTFTVDSIYNIEGDKWGATITVTKI